MIESIALCAYYAAIILCFYYIIIILYYFKQYTTTMSNNTTPTLFPRTLLHCMKDGMLNHDLFNLYNKKKRHLRSEEEYDHMISQCLDEEKNDNDTKKANS